MAPSSGDRHSVRQEFGHRLSAKLARAALRAGGPALESRSVGNALLVHPRGFVDSQALTFTERLAADPQHTLVVLDLPARPQESVWETVARTLDRRGSSFRLVPGRGTREDVKLAAQWLADRLQRVVVAPDGAVVPAAGGTLFVPAHHGLGWLRYRPHLPSTRDSRHFPRPQWEVSVPDRPWPTGAGGLVEPLPAGVWIRGSWEDAAVPAHRKRLMDLLVAHQNLLGVAIGSPGGSALPIEEIAAFWQTLPTTVRTQVRFIPYGPVAAPDGKSLGQALADQLGQRVALYAGVPVPGADGQGPEMRTLQRDGTLGWRPYADEFGFTPRSLSGGRTPAPVALNTRPPVATASFVAPGVYQFAPEAFVEVVQSGLWVRPATEPRDGDSVRLALADPAHPAVLYDGTDPLAADRMRLNAYELLSGLDPSFGRHSRIMPSSEATRLPGGGHPLIVSGPPSPDATHMREAPANGRVPEGAPSAPGTHALPPVEETWADHRPELESDPGADPPAAQPKQLPHLAPRSGPPDAQPPTALHRRQPPISPTGPPGTAPEPPAPVPHPAATDRATGTQAAIPSHPGAPRVPTAPLPPLAAVPPTPETPADVPPTPEPPAAVAPAASSDPAAPAPALVPPAPAVTALAAPRIRLESPTPQPVVSGARPAARTEEATRNDGPPDGGRATEPAAAPPQNPSASTGAGTFRIQPAPTAAASVAPPEKGLARERDWVRRSLGERYDTAAAFVSRVLSESPGLSGGPRNSAADVLTDLAAVRLYLSGATGAIDAAIRAGAPGPHVPLARCAASGLRRLPSYRGAAILRAPITAAERGWYEEGKVVTENSFFAALSTIRRDMPGTTDVLLWSLTARRTALVAPEIPDRVLFAPGTRLKVLRVEDGDRPTVMLRELVASEVDEHGRTSEERVPLDEISLAGLAQARTFWSEAENDPDGQAGEPLSDEHLSALRAAPGLQIRSDGPGGPRHPAPHTGTVPQNGGKV